MSQITLAPLALIVTQRIAQYTNVTHNLKECKRLKLAKSQHLYVNRLGHAHSVKDRKSKHSSSHCGKIHHSLLNYDSPAAAQQVTYKFLVKHNHLSGKNLIEFPPPECSSRLVPFTLLT